MSREEIIKEAAADHWSCVCCGFDDPIADAREESFIEGAEWADEHPKKGLVSLDKVCEWIDENILKAYIHLEEDEIFYSDDLIGRLRKDVEK